ncbi:MAG: hypothetical protein MI741_09710, partial [Rhodospirillales bacterium]|nr:hypothetical protein [Rhodospirillales bacterium]
MKMFGAYGGAVHALNGGKTTVLARSIAADSVLRGFVFDGGNRDVLFCQGQLDFDCQSVIPVIGPNIPFHLGNGGETDGKAEPGAAIPAG